jgi:hypothetical protein
MNDEGWTWLTTSDKWHYFIDGVSLCGKWELLPNNHGSLQQGMDSSPGNCATCRKSLEKRQTQVTTPQGADI